MPQGIHFQLARESIRTMTADQVVAILNLIPKTVANVPAGYVPHPDTVNFGPAWSIRSDHHTLRFVFLFGHPEPETIVVFTADEWMRAVAERDADMHMPSKRWTEGSYGAAIENLANDEMTRLLNGQDKQEDGES